MRLQTICFLVLIGFYADAQPISIQWQRCYGGSFGDEAKSIKGTYDNGYLIGGETISDDGDVSGNHYEGHSEYWIVKIDSTGYLEWQKCYGGSQSEFNESMALMENYFIAVGSAGSSDGDVSASHNSSADYWCLKGDSVGNKIWETNLGGSNHDWPNEIINLSNYSLIIGYSNSNDYDVIGQHDSICNFCSDVWVVKIDTTGTIIWSKCFGGTDSELGYSIAMTSDSGFILASSTLSNDGDVAGLHSFGWEDYWIVKIDKTGLIEWQKCYGGSYIDKPRNIINTSDGGYIVTGSSASDNGDVSGHHGGLGDEDAWIVKIDSIGNLQWQKSLGGTALDFGYKVIQMQDNGFLLLNYSSSTDGDLINDPSSFFDVWLVKMDLLGNILWSQTFGGSGDEAAYDLLLTNDGGALFTGLTFSNDGDVSGNHGNGDMWVVKLSPLPDKVSNINHPTDFAIYFNSTTNDLHLSYYAIENEIFQISILDITGRIIIQQEIKAERGFNEKEIHVGQHSSGIYLVKITSDGSITRKVIMN